MLSVGSGNGSVASASFLVSLTTCSSLVATKKLSVFKELNLTQKYSMAAIVSTYLIMHAKIGARATMCSLLLVLTPPDNHVELLHPPIHMQLGLKWNVKVALMRFLPSVNPTQHTRCFRHTRLIILSLSTKHGSACESDRELWAERQSESE